jgi:hypothetical protein
MPARPKRARAERREQQRLLRKGVRVRDKLATSGPGGASDRPVVVASASVIEGHARSVPCPQCSGVLEVESHQAAVETDTLLRFVKVVCRLCHARRQIWYRIEEVHAS